MEYFQGLKVTIDASGRVLGTDACAKKIDFTQLLEFPRFERDTHQSFRLGSRKVNFLEEMCSHGDARVSSYPRFGGDPRCFLPLCSLVKPPTLSSHSDPHTTYSQPLSHGDVFFTNSSEGQKRAEKA